MLNINSVQMKLNLVIYDPIIVLEFIINHIALNLISFMVKKCFVHLLLQPHGNSFILIKYNIIFDHIFTVLHMPQS